MARKTKLKPAKSNRKTTAAKPRPKKKAARSAPRKAAIGARAAAPAPSTPMMSRDVVEEILVHSAKSDEGERLSDKALLQVAGAAGLDPTRVLAVHQRLCEAAEAEATTVFQVVELWGPEEEEEEEEEGQE